MIFADDMGEEIIKEHNMKHTMNPAYLTEPNRLKFLNESPAR